MVIVSLLIYSPVMEDIEGWVIGQLASGDKYTEDSLHWVFCLKYIDRSEMHPNSKILHSSTYHYDRVIQAMTERGSLKLVDQTYEMARISTAALAKTASKMSCFYVIDFGDGCKIGISSNFGNRIRTYLSAWCKPMISIHVIKCDKPRIIEDYMMSSEIRPKSSIGEFLPLTSEHIRDLVTKKFPKYTFNRFRI